MQTFCGLTTDGMLDYLGAIYRLGESLDKVTTSALAEQMHVSAPAASSMLKRLEESRLVERSSVDGVSLTDQGRLAALQLIRRHRLLEVFLIQTMGFTWDQVDSEAHRLEHAVSSAFEDRMDRLCGYPTHCPHGDPIPTKDGQIVDVATVTLVEMAPGGAGVLHRVTSRDARVLRYLARLGLMPGKAVRLVEVGPFNGPVTVDLLADIGADADHPVVERHILGHELAQTLLVQSGQPQTRPVTPFLSPSRPHALAANLL